MKNFILVSIVVSLISCKVSKNTKLFELNTEIVKISYFPSDKTSAFSIQIDKNTNCKLKTDKNLKCERDKVLEWLDKISQIEFLEASQIGGYSLAGIAETTLEISDINQKFSFRIRNLDKHCHLIYLKEQPKAKYIEPKYCNLFSKDYNQLRPVNILNHKTYDKITYTKENKSISFSKSEKRKILEYLSSSKVVDHLFEGSIDKNLLLNFNISQNRNNNLIGELEFHKNNEKESLSFGRSNMEGVDINVYIKNANTIRKYSIPAWTSLSDLIQSKL